MRLIYGPSTLMAMQIVVRLILEFRQGGTLMRGRVLNVYRRCRRKIWVAGSGRCWAGWLSSKFGGHQPSLTQGYSRDPTGQRKRDSARKWRLGCLRRDGITNLVARSTQEAQVRIFATALHFNSHPNSRSGLYEQFADFAISREIYRHSYKRMFPMFWP